MSTFHLTVASVGESKFEREALSVSVPGASGVLTVLPHHEPFVATLQKGTVHVVDTDGTKESFNVEGGILEVAHNRVVVLL